MKTDERTPRLLTGASKKLIAEAPSKGELNKSTGGRGERRIKR